MKKKRTKTGLACAGGGVEGAIYEIGALCALEESLTGITFNKLDIYVGVSAGALVSSCLANSINPWEMCRIILSRNSSHDPIQPATFFKPAFGEYWRKATNFPAEIAKSLQRYITRPGDISLLGSLSQVVNSLPVGYFNNDPLRAYLEHTFIENGLTDDFRKLKSKLRVVATDLDSGKAAVFGRDMLDHIPISKAVQASSAFPAVYLPVEINGRQYIDGVARKTVHASVALEEGAELLFCINPIIPLDYVQKSEVDKMIKASLSQNGLPSVLSQVFRTMIHSRMKIGLKAYESQFPESDIILLEPRQDDYKMFFTNIFSFRNRLEVAEHGYQTTREILRNQSEEISKKLHRHDVYIRTRVLEENRTMLDHPRLELSESEFIPDDLDRTLDHLDNLLGKVG